MPDNRPQSLQLTVNVGITGHRASILPAGVIEPLERAVDQVLRELRNAALRIPDARCAISSAMPVKLRLHTALASGADQVAAKYAHAGGYQVRALLPFAPDEYRKDFVGDELAEFNRALDAADEVVALSGDSSDRDAAYVSVGEAVIAAADILVAVWDGGAGNGPGGTAHVVDLALAGAVPVIHIAIDRDRDEITTRLLVGGNAARPLAEPLSGPDAYLSLLRETLKAARGGAQA